MLNNISLLSNNRVDSGFANSLSVRHKRENGLIWKNDAHEYISSTG